MRVHPPDKIRKSERYIALSLLQGVHFVGEYVLYTYYLAQDTQILP